VPLQLDLLGDGQGTPLHSWRLWSESSGFEALTEGTPAATATPLSGAFETACSVDLRL
jgi:hypothetical protein